MIEKATIEKMISLAMECVKNSYAPYSHYNVGATVLMDSGKMYTGVNVENAAFGCTICAERNAIIHAIAEGEKKILAIAIVAGIDLAETGEIDTYGTPCGTCRQVMREFSDPEEMIVISARSETDYKVKTLDELLPESFGPEWL